MKAYQKIKIGLCTTPIKMASIQPLTQLVEILLILSTKFTLITGNAGDNLFSEDSRLTFFGINYSMDRELLKIPLYLLGQLMISICIIKSSREVDKWFFLGGQRSLFPIFTAKFLKKGTVIVMGGSAIRDASFSEDNFQIFTKILTKCCLSLTDNIIIYSPNLISEWNLKFYKQKILIVHRHFIDFDKFSNFSLISDRPLYIGYIGRLSREKGIQSFIQALPKICFNQPNIRVLIGGNGDLKEYIIAFLKKNGILDHVDMPGWISHDELPIYLNKLRLLVLPSYTEGLPNIVLEAMACGTPVLATPVGAIPDLITDGNTGFIMKNNSPDCIEMNVMRSLQYPSIEKIANNARQFVITEFCYDKIIKKWELILSELK